MDKEPRYGYFSQKSIESAERAFGRQRPTSVWYTTPTGGRVLVTQVGDTEDPRESGYLWDDAVCVGEIAEYAYPQPKGWE